MSLNNLPPEALKAAMIGGTESWGQWGSADQHIRYIQRAPSALRRRCNCGCKRRASHSGMANGVCLTSGCELSMRRWAAIRD